MDVNFLSYFKEPFEIVKYVLAQVEWQYISDYYNYIFVAGAVFLAGFILMRVIVRRRSVDKYIEDGVAVMIGIPPESKVEDEIQEILADLYVRNFTMYGRKHYFVLESLIWRNRKSFFIFLPAKIYAECEEQWRSKYSLKLISKSREDFFGTFSRNIVELEFELFQDFIVPLNFRPRMPVNLSSILLGEECIFIQLLCRPCGDRWRKVLDSYLDDLKKGKDSSRQLTGCLGGCIAVVLPVFSSLADLVTGIVYSNGKDKHKVEKHETKNTFSDKNLEKKYHVVQLKRGRYGFETLLRICVKAKDSDRRYFLLEKLFDMLGADEKQGLNHNHYVVKNIHKKFKESARTDLLFAHLEQSSIDILNEEEVMQVLRLFL